MRIMFEDSHPSLRHAILSGLKKAEATHQLGNLEISSVIVTDAVREYMASKIITITKAIELKHAEEVVEVYQQLIDP